jgi:hypothetical protein
MQNLMFREWMRHRYNQILMMRSSVPIGCLLFLWLCAGSIASAQTNQPGLDQFSPNPLEITTPDPLTPTSESLSSTQRDELSAALDGLNLEAVAKQQAGDGVPPPTAKPSKPRSLATTGVPAAIASKVLF